MDNTDMLQTFKLSHRDKLNLMRWGYTPNKFKQIEDATNEGIFMNKKSREISWQTAQRYLGSAGFLKGISDAAFNWTAKEENEKNKQLVYFNFSKYFKI